MWWACQVTRLTHGSASYVFRMARSSPHAWLGARPTIGDSVVTLSRWDYGKRLE